MSIWAAIPTILQTVGGLFRGGAANSIARITGGSVVRGAQPAAQAVAAPGSGVLGRSILGGAIGSTVAGPAFSTAGGGLVAAGRGLQGLSGQGGMLGVRKKRRAKGITGAQLKGFRRVYNFLESHCEPRLKIKRKKR